MPTKYGTQIDVESGIEANDGAPQPEQSCGNLEKRPHGNAECGTESHQLETSASATSHLKPTLIREPKLEQGFGHMLLVTRERKSSILMPPRFCHNKLTCRAASGHVAADTSRKNVEA